MEAHGAAASHLKLSATGEAVQATPLMMFLPGAEPPLQQAGGLAGWQTGRLSSFLLGVTGATADGQVPQ